MASKSEENKIMETPLVSIVIPTYNRKSMLVRLLDSIYGSDYPLEKLEIIVINDASTDGTEGEIEEKYPKVKLITNKDELFSSLSRNIGIKNAKAEFIFLIDDDNVVDKSCISELINVITSTEKSYFVGPLMYYYSDRKRVAWAGAKRNKLTSLTKVFTEFSNSKSIQKTEYVPNAIMIRKKIAEKVGMFDGKNFPFHYDDGDFCQRAKMEGCDIVFSTKAKVWHDIPLPEKINDRTRLFHCNTEKLAYYNSRSRILYQHKYTSKGQFFIFLIIFNWAVALYYFKIILIDSKKTTREKFHLLKAYFKGNISGLRTIFND